jgi:hypothetical protein
MTARRARIAAVGALLLSGPLASAADLVPTYLRRLALPVAGDDIRFGQCVAADLHTGEIFVCDPRANRLLVFDPEGRFRYQILGGEGMTSPDDIAVDPDGFLFVAGSHARQHGLVLELDFDGLFRRAVPLVGLPADAATARVGSLALSPDGERLYAVDTANQALWIADREGRVRTGIDLKAGRSEAEQGDLALGHVDVYGERVVLAVPSDGEVRVFDLDGEPLGIVGAKGGSRCRLGWPVAAAVTDGDEVLIVDQQRMVVSRWSLADNRCLGEYLGLGAAPGLLYYPADLALDASGRFLVAQTFEGRVQMYEGLGRAAAAPAAVVP